MKKRNSNIELLRIIAIVMIVISHYCVHGGVNFSNLPIGLNRIILETFVLGNLGTIIFILISGYYLINSKGIKLKKIARLVLQIFFYSSSIYIILYAINLVNFDILDLKKSMFPITYRKYWFATAYIIMYIFHPYINKLLNNINRKEHFNFIAIMFIIFSVLNFITNVDYYGGELIQFLLFYSIGAYFYKYPDNYLSKNHHSVIIMTISTLIIIISVISYDLYGSKILFFQNNSIYFLSRTSPVAILLCTSLFSIFIKKEKKENKLINKIGSLVFGIYLISDNDYLRPILWNNIFHNALYSQSKYLIIHLVLAVTLTIISCLAIETDRKYILEKKIFKYIDKIIDKIEKKIGTQKQHNI